MYEDMIAYVKNFFEENDRNGSELPVKYPFRNRYEHSMRVYKWAMRINQKERGDKTVVAVAAIFHDIGKALESDTAHAESGAILCDEYLRKIGFPDDKREKVIRSIRLHSSKDMPAGKLSKEDKILMDADLLDEVGALAVLWDSMATGLEADPSYHKAYERHRKYYSQLKKQKKYIKTKQGRKLFEARVRFLGAFIKNLKYELGM